MVKNKKMEKWEPLLTNKETKIPIINLKDFMWIYRLLGWDKNDKQQPRHP